MQTTPARRRGFTLIEFLFVAGIALTALSVALSAIQRSREAARLVACKNNLKIHGIALHNYHETFGTFPPAWTASSAAPGIGPRLGWQTFLLPQVDYGPLYDQFHYGALKQFHVPREIPQETLKLLQTPIETYRCPSDPTSPTNPIRGAYGTSNYSANHGNLSLPRWTTGRQTVFWPGQMETPRKANGIMYWNSNVEFRDCSDGPSNTFLVGERCITSASGIWPGVGSNEFENDAVTECSHGSRPNHSITSFSSAHEGGVQFVMGDGRVVFISDSIDSKPVSEGELGIYQRLSRRNDKLPVNGF